MKKNYSRPHTICIQMELQSIICSSADRKINFSGGGTSGTGYIPQ